MGSKKSAEARYTGGLRFDVQTGSGHQLQVDGEMQMGPSPMDLVLVGLAGCTGIDVVTILKKMRQEVTDLTIRVAGERAEDAPNVYTEIAVEYLVTGRGLDANAVERAVDLSETKYCSVGAMLDKTARITHTITLKEATSPAGEANVSALTREP